MQVTEGTFIAHGTGYKLSDALTCFFSESHGVIDSTDFSGTSLECILVDIDVVGNT